MSRWRPIEWQALWFSIFKKCFSLIIYCKKTVAFKFLTFVRIVLYAGNFICNKTFALIFIIILAFWNASSFTYIWHLFQSYGMNLVFFFFYVREGRIISAIIVDHTCDITVGCYFCIHLGTCTALWVYVGNTDLCWTVTGCSLHGCYSTILQNLQGCNFSAVFYLRIVLFYVSNYG
jgi:hypothetical protein